MSELAVIYRAQRREEIEVDRARSLIANLVALRESIEGKEIEARLAALEGGDLTPRETLSEPRRALPSPAEAIDAEAVEIER